MPEWIIEMWDTDYGEEITNRILRGLTIEQKISVRCNLSIAEKEIIMQALEADGVTVEPVEGIKEALFIDNIDNIALLNAHKNGWIQVQDISSMQVCKRAEIKNGDTVIDVCAAPGGKTLHAGDILNGTGVVDSRDVSKEKVSLIQENIKRTGFTNIKVKIWDALCTDLEIVNTADVLIADLPCSGLGIAGKKTDIKYKTTKEQILELANLQKKMLKTVSSYVKPGGILMYSTCTITKQENDWNADWFKENFPFEEEERLQIFPGDSFSDGFFIAKFRRKKMNKIDIKSITLDELKNEMQKIGEKSFRGEQIYTWIHQKLVLSFDDMTNISEKLKNILKENFFILSLQEENVFTSKIDGTKKFLFALDDGNVIESVLMKYKHGNSVCLSTQAGCRQGCRSLRLYYRGTGQKLRNIRIT